MLLNLGVELHHERRGEYPKDLADLSMYFSRVWLDENADEWGHRYRYSLTATGYTLFSSGPDGLANTGDDVFAARRTDLCEVSRNPVREGSLPVPRKLPSGCGCSFADF